MLSRFKPYIDRVQRQALLRLARIAPRAFGLERLGAFHATDEVDRWHTHLRTNCGVWPGLILVGRA